MRLNFIHISVNQLKVSSNRFHQAAKLFYFFSLFVVLFQQNVVEIVEKWRRQIKALLLLNLSFLIPNSDIPSRAETDVFAAVCLIRCGCGGQLPTPFFSRS